MKPPVNNYIFEEAFKIISLNKSKANSLRQSILCSMNYDNDLNLKIRQYLGEFEYDLKILYDIITDIKSLFDKNENTLNISTTVEPEGDQSHMSISNDIKNEKRFLKKNNSTKLFNKHKNKLYLNDLDDSETNNSNSNKKGGKSYSLTINICNDSHFNSHPKKKYNKKFNRSNSCKSYIGRKYNLSKNDFNFRKNNNNKNKNIEKRYKYFIDDQIINENNDNRYLLQNNRRYTYTTDYLHDKDNRKNSYNYNVLNSNINKNKLSLKNLNNLYEHYNTLLNTYNTTNNNDNKNERIKSQNYSNREDKNNFYSLDGLRNNQNPRNNAIPRLDLDKIGNNNYNYNINNNKDDYNNDNNYYRNKYNDNIVDNNSNYNNILNTNVSEKSKIENNKNDEQSLNNFIELKNNLYQKENINNCNYTNNRNNRNNNIYESEKNKILLNINNNNDNDILEDEKKKEIIKGIISSVLQDSNKLNELKKYFGDNIGDKLIEGDISQKYLFRMVDILNNYQTNLKNNNKNDKNLFRGSKNNYKSMPYKRFDSLNNKGYSYKDYPLGLLSMNNNLNY